MDLNLSAEAPKPLTHACKAQTRSAAGPRPLPSYRRGQVGVGETFARILDL